jgi:hypothetical protein
VPARGELALELFHGRLEVVQALAQDDGVGALVVAVVLVEQLVLGARAARSRGPPPSS